MPTQITGTGGIDKIQAGTVVSASFAPTAQLPLGNSANSMVRLNTANGYGSTNTVIRRFTTVVTNQGSDITYDDSATLGASFTINTTGVYAITYTSQMGTTNAVIGVSVNSTQLTTSIINISASNRLCNVQTYTGGATTHVSWTGYLPAGAVIRAHDDGNAATAGAIPQFTIVRVA